MSEINEHPVLEVVAIEEQFLLYQGLLALIQHGDGTGFRNRDKRHALYFLEYREGERSYPFGENFSPENDTLFRCLKKLSGNISNFGGNDLTWFREIKTWGDFQKLVKDLNPSG
jgi:hypothetical protein